MEEPNEETWAEVKQIVDAGVKNFKPGPGPCAKPDLGTTEMSAKKVGIYLESVSSAQLIAPFIQVPPPVFPPIESTLR